MPSFFFTSAPHCLALLIKLKRNLHIYYRVCVMKFYCVTRQDKQFLCLIWWPKPQRSNYFTKFIYRTKTRPFSLNIKDDGGGKGNEDLICFFLLQLQHTSPWPPAKEADDDGRRKQQMGIFPQKKYGREINKISFVVELEVNFLTER